MLERESSGGQDAVLHLRQIREEKDIHEFADYLGQFAASHLTAYVDVQTRPLAIGSLQEASGMLAEICGNKEAGQSYISSLFNVISDTVLLP